MIHVQLMFTWNPSLEWPSRFSLDYLLLQPRSATIKAPGKLKSDPFNAIIAFFLLIMSSIFILFNKKFKKNILTN